MIDEIQKQTVGLGTYLKNPEKLYARTISDLEKCGFRVSTFTLERTGSPHDYKEPTLFSPNNNKYEGERTIARWIIERAKSAGINLEERV